MRIGAMELLVIFAVALLVVGPDKLPDFARKLGEVLGQLKGYSDKVVKEIQETVVEPMEEIAQPFQEALKPLEEVDKTIRCNMREVEKSVSSIGKPVKKPVLRSLESPVGEAPEEEVPPPVERVVDPEEEEILRQLKEIQAREGQTKGEEVGNLNVADSN